MVKIDIDKLELSIYNAIKVARKAVANIPDDGTCNFDEVIVEINATRTEIMSMEYKCEKEKRYKARDNHWVNLYSVDINADGQANKRTVMTEMVVKKLNEDGFNAYVKYVMD